MTMIAVGMNAQIDSNNSLFNSKSIKIDTSYNVRYILWFTPNKVEKINGLALGVYTENIKNNHNEFRDSLIINGLNVEVNPIAVLSLLYSITKKPYSDDIEYYYENIQSETETSINGINLSVSAFIYEAKVNGLNVVFFKNVAHEVYGISFVGFTSFSYIMKGLSMATLCNINTKADGVQISIYNQATELNGVQIGIVNKSKKTRGLQLGLWNINEKRSLPFINWNFKKYKKH